MAIPKTKLSHYSVDDYLAIERSTDERNEYLNGQIRAMAGESPEHGTISVNLIGELFPQLKGTSCLVWTKDCKVRSGPAPSTGHSTKGLYSYPDLVIVCGPPEFHDEHQDVLVNPKVIAAAQAQKLFSLNPLFSASFSLIENCWPTREHVRRPSDIRV